MIYDDEIKVIKAGTVLYDKLGKRSMVVFDVDCSRFGKASYKEFYVFYTSSKTNKGRYAVVGELDLKSYFDVIVL